MNTGMNQMDLLPQEDLLNTILADLKRTVREYTTATTESACPTVRQMFNQLTDDTLKLQGQLFQVMSQNNMYTMPAKAPRTELDKEVQCAQDTIQKTGQFIQQRATMGAGSYGQQQGQSTTTPNHFV
ncbi:Coat F domain protein [compost metagenome]